MLRQTLKPSGELAKNITLYFICIFICTEQYSTHFPEFPPHFLCRFKECFKQIIQLKGNRNSQILSTPQKPTKVGPKHFPLHLNY